MGVPALFRWLSNKYPKIISSVVEEQAREVDGETVPVDTRGPNPNGEEFDNLYLDMNGIVHPCSHPEDKPAPANEEEMMIEVFKYTDRVVNMVRPRKLLMIAVDGVAPRAKMNQQRSRRFRSAQEAKEKDDDKEEFLKLLKQQNGGTIDEDVHATIVKKTWDSNLITPGTPFMDILAASLRYWVSYKLTTDPAWEKLKIIISDATVPGEGEHKIMEFVRSQRRQQTHDPNARHVIYGLDADLIMLGLATHEPHFRVLREDVFFQESKQKTCPICNQTGHRAEECKGEAKKKEGEFDEKQGGAVLKPFIWLHVSILREYLAAELNVPHQPFKFDLERALDDWVFMCFFVGNDFLPHLPSLDIRDNGIDILISIWRENIPIMGGYVTKDGQVDLQRAQFILAGLAKQEDGIFKRRKQGEERREANAKRRKLEQESRNGGRNSNGGQDTPSQRGRGRKPSDVPRVEDLVTYKPGELDSREARAREDAEFINRKTIYQANMANKSAAAALKAQLTGKAVPETPAKDVDATDGEAAPEPAEPTTPASALGKRKAELMEDESSTPGRNTPDSNGTPKADADEPPPDEVRLWEEGYADRYYESKFKVDKSDIAFRRKVANAYVEGLCWVLLYYFQGCPSWTWYYPYHYAPFAADFVDIDSLRIAFDKGKPFRPYEQLMGVLPAASSHAIPEVFRSLMTDEDSDIVHFYPEEFPIDLNGKKFAWQGVAILPWIDENRLLAAMATRYPQLTDEERARNAMGSDTLLLSTTHPLHDAIAQRFYAKRRPAGESTDADDTTLTIDPALSHGLHGRLTRDPDYLPNRPLVFPLDTAGMPDLDEDASLALPFDMPKSDHPHKSMLLRGVKFPPPTLDAADIEATRQRAARGGRPPPRGGGYHRNGYGGDGGGRGGRDGYRGGRGNGHGNRGGSADRGGPLNLDNPFAKHLTPGFDPAMMGNLPPPPPPHMAMANGWMAPPPGGFGRGGMPPMPPQGGYSGYPGGRGGGGGGGGGYRGGRGGGGGGGGGGGYEGGRGGGGGYRGDGYSGGGGGAGYQRDGYSGGGGYQRDGYSGGGGRRDDDRYGHGGQRRDGYGSGGGGGGGYGGGYQGGRRDDNRGDRRSGGYGRY